MSTSKFTRRNFLKTSGAAGAGLVIGFHIPWVSGCAGPPLVPLEGGAEPNAWIRIDPAGFVHVVYGDHEMGQGSSTSFMMMVCEEMEADWEMMLWEPVPTNPAGWERTISTGGSTTIRNAWGFIRTAGAQAKEVLRQAAANRWEVDVSECVAQNHTITHEGSGRSLGYGEIAVEASALPVPEDPPLKAHADYWLVGHDTARLDLPDKVTGVHQFGMDLRLPGMLFASVSRPPAFQGGIRSFIPLPGPFPVWWTFSRSKAASPLLPTTLGRPSRGVRPWWSIGIRDLLPIRIRNPFGREDGPSRTLPVISEDQEEKRETSLGDWPELPRLWKPLTTRRFSIMCPWSP